VSGKQRDNIYALVAWFVIFLALVCATVTTMRTRDAARDNALAPEGAFASYSGPWMLFDDGSCVLPVDDAQWTGMATNAPERLTMITSALTSNTFWTLRMPNSRVFYVTGREFERIKLEPGGALREDSVWLVRDAEADAPDVITETKSHGESTIVSPGSQGNAPQ